MAPSVAVKRYDELSWLEQFKNSNVLPGVPASLATRISVFGCSSS